MSEQSLSVSVRTHITGHLAITWRSVPGIKTQSQTATTKFSLQGWKEMAVQSPFATPVTIASLVLQPQWDTAIPHYSAHCRLPHWECHGTVVIWLQQLPYPWFSQTKPREALQQCRKFPFGDRTTTFKVWRHGVTSGMDRLNEEECSEKCYQ